MNEQRLEQVAPRKLIIKPTMGSYDYVEYRIMKSSKGGIVFVLYQQPKEQPLDCNKCQKYDDCDKTKNPIECKYFTSQPLDEGLHRKLVKILDVGISNNRKLGDIATHIIQDCELVKLQMERDIAIKEVGNWARKAGLADVELAKLQARIKELETKLKTQWEWSQSALDWRESEIVKAKAEAYKEILDIAEQFDHTYTTMHLRSLLSSLPDAPKEQEKK
jgi:hypothetical protein